MSIVHQINKALKHSSGISISKKDTKDALGVKVSPYIHSNKYYEHVLNTSVQFGKWVKEEYGVKSMYDMKVEHTQAFLQHLKESGVTKGHMMNVESHLMKLQQTLTKFNSEVRGRNERVELIKERSVQAKDREDPHNRAFKTRENAERIIQRMSPATRPAGELGLNLGLRIRESVGIRVEHIQDLGERMRLHIPVGEANGITKGGRFRTVEVPSRFHERLRDLIKDKAPEERIVSASRDAVQKSFGRACKASGESETGFHRFRHTFARERLSERLEGVRGAKEVVEKMMDNKSLGFRLDKGVSRSEKDLIDKVKYAINAVHSELGHGKGRWDLVKTYMMD